MIRIPEQTTIIGELRCDGATRVDGRVEGDGNIEGLLLISKSCVWIGNVTADCIIIDGVVEGNVIAREKLEISRIARISGKISAPKMHISRGASLNCEVHVPNSGDVVEINEHKPAVRHAAEVYVNMYSLNRSSKKSA